MSLFPGIRIEGGLLGPDTLDQILTGELPGQKPSDFGLDGRRTLTDEIASAFADARAQWEVFQRRLERLPESDVATSVTRDTWVVPFLSLLGYELRYNARAYEVDGATFAISHRAGEAEDAPPVHIVGVRQELGRVAPTGRPRLAPHSLVQEFLNRTEHLWGIVTNGLTLRLLRDSTYIRRQSYIEFDLQQIFEEQRFGDFVVLYRLLHRTRLPRIAADARDCLLEQYYQNALEQGGRVRDRLRDGVEECIKRLANGFLAHPDNGELRARLASSERRVASGMASSERRVASGMASSERRVASGMASSERRVASGMASSERRVASSEEEEPLATHHSPLANSPLAPEEFYRQLLRLVYRFLFLLVSEDRGLISADPLYREHYGIARLRRLVDRRSAYTEHDDLWCSLRVLWKVLSDEQLARLLGAAPLNGQLFEPCDLDACTITNRDLLEAFWHLAYYRESPSQPPRRVNYAALDVEELGSVYESLLDYHPVVMASSEWRVASSFRFELVYGSERKSTGSYYTPPELVAELIRSALDPVIEERLAEAKRMAGELQRVASSEWRVVQEKIQQLVGEKDADSIVSRLGSLAESYGSGRTGVSPHEHLPERGAVRHDQPDAPGGDVGASEHRRGLGSTGDEGISPIPQHRRGEPPGAGDLSPARRTDWDRQAGTRPSPSPDARNPEQADGQPPAQSQTEVTRSITDLPALWTSLPLATRHSLLARACAEHALLSIRVLDPACGSGHFLLAAARRLGKELARIRTGEDEPAPERVREAIRDVVAHCIYGVDKNPLAVELCRVALWLEAHCAGKPLTFLDHRIRCGDSLVGVFDLEVLEKGIPDDAFAPASSDDKTAANQLKKRNRNERRDLENGQLSLPFHPESLLPVLGKDSEAVAAIADDSPAEVRRKKELYERHQHDPQRWRLVQACNLWTAAFFQRMANSEWRMEKGITTQVVADHLAGRTHPQVVAEAEALAAQHRFFHWPLEFPEVFSASSELRVASSHEEEPLATHHSPFAAPIRHSPFANSGFDVVIGNPPWERIKLQEQEFFATRDLEIANAPTAALRKRLIQKLKDDSPALWREYQAALHGAESTSRFLRGAGSYPLTGRGDINTYSVFAERVRRLLRAGGRAGIIVPTGIATDDTNKFFFGALVERGELASLYDFENRKKLFPAVDSRMKFCLLTLRNVGARHAVPLPSAEFAFFCHEARELSDPERRFTLTAEDFRLLNPNTRTAPIFRSRRDAELTKHIYRRVPVLLDENKGGAGNPWGVEFFRMFDMANDSHLFRTREELERAGYRLVGNVFQRGAERYLPLYEAKLVHQFDHRWASYGGPGRLGQPPEAGGPPYLERAPRKADEAVKLTADAKADPELVVLPRYWVAEREVEAKLAEKGWSRGWLLGWRDITNATNERTVIAAVIPRVAVGSKFLLMMVETSDHRLALCLLANLNALALDYVARQKLSGTDLTYTVMKQLPVLPPGAYAQPCPWHPGQTLAEWFRPRVLELVYTAWDLAPFARDLGYDSPPFRWDEERRFQLRCELDALFFLLYLGTPEEWTREASAELKALFPTPRDAVAYILDQFPIVRRKDEERYGEYRTKRRILEIYDTLLEAIQAPRVPVFAGQTAAPSRHAGFDRYNQAAVLTLVVARLGRGDLGRVGHDKVMYFVQEHLGVDLGLNFERKAAGPWDPDLKYKVEPLATKQGWLAVRGEQGGISRLELGPNAEAALKQAEKKLADRLRDVEEMCRFFNTLGFGTSGLERWATIHKCWKDLQAAHGSVTEEMLIQEVLAWKGDRPGYDEQSIRDALWGMRKKRLIVLEEDS